ncbi:zinc-binding dehydrogenase [Microbacterium halophytorum]|uniref:zinc-binding dehydrogenase n=1 Tax=Microbacterium halophytorum TaxID=2067568 RepID=UPI000CFCF58E|nr:zinc-binding dehydrogenase [Microbacterium halophytorum]
MRAAFIDGKDTLEVRAAELPVPGDGQVRLKVDYVGVCGSDLHYYFEGANGEYAVREPLVPGHELAGRVDSDPSGAWPVGTPVTVHPARFGESVPGVEDAPHLWPGGSYLGSASTWPHTQGAMTEYLIVDERMVRALPSGLSVRRATLAEPLGVALHAVARAGDVAGRRVLVSGAGPIGLLAVVTAQARGAASVTVADVLPEALERAEALGADAVVRVGAEELPREAFDVVLECSGAPAAISAAAAAAVRRGVIVQVGMVPDRALPVNLAPLIAKEVELRGTFRFRDEIDAAIDLLAVRADVESVITHEYGLDDVVEAFATARDGKRSSKVVVAL